MASRPKVGSDQRVGIFIDVQNMFYSAKYKYRGKLDYEKLLQQIQRDRKVIRALCYAVQTPEIDQTSFLNILQSMGFEIRIKDLKLRPDGTAKGDWDMGIAIDAMSLSSKLDVVALVSGDGDFSALVELLKAQGVKVEVYAFRSNTADELIKSATQFVPLDESVILSGSMQPLEENVNGRGGRGRR
ncbi:MAG TPA: NYN domain-containing protein [bacterium]|nr:NYN domain-containing protein [bacterium]